MEVRRTEYKIHTANGQVLIEKVTDIPLLNKKNVLDSTVITLSPGTYEKLVLEKNDKGTYTLTVKVECNDDPEVRKEGVIQMEVKAENILPYLVTAELLAERPGGTLYTITSKESKTETKAKNSKKG